MNQTALQPPPTDPGPPILTPPDRKYREPAVHRNHGVALIIAALFFLLLLAGGVIWFLPNHNREQQSLPPEHSPKTEWESVEPTAPPHPDPLAEREMEQALDHWLRIRIRAEAENADQWGAKEYQEAITGGYDGDRLRREQEYADARDVYSESAAALEQLLADKENRLSIALKNGHDALERHDGEEAARSFAIALAIAPDNDEALHGTQRASHLEQVLDLQRKAEQSIRDNDLETGRNLLLQALSLDPEFSPARTLSADVTKRMEQNEFRRLIGQGLLALEAQQFSLAQQSMNGATALQKDDPAIKKLQIMLDSARLGHELATLQQKADDHGAAEQWADCAKVYKKALALAPRASFAIEGLRRAEDRLTLDQKLEEIIAKPQRLQEDGPLEEARQLLSTARTISKPGPLLSGRIVKVTDLLKSATTMIDVILQSDGLTSVVIHRVGEFGTFTSKQLSLRPGSYTVVGSRPGFRDVRLSVNVTPEQNPVFIIIRCEEPI